MDAQELMAAARMAGMPQKHVQKSFREQLVESIAEFKSAIERREQLLALMNEDPKIEEFISLSKEL